MMFGARAPCGVSPTTPLPPLGSEVGMPKPKLTPFWLKKLLLAAPNGVPIVACGGAASAVPATIANAADIPQTAAVRFTAVQLRRRMAKLLCRSSCLAADDCKQSAANSQHVAGVSPAACKQDRPQNNFASIVGRNLH